MNTIIMTALTAFGIAGAFGSPAMDECCAKRAADCCTTSADNCCEKKKEGCCETMKDECCTWTSVYDGKRTFKRYHCVQPGKAPSADAAQSGCTSKDGCNAAFFTEGKTSVRRSFCEQDGKRVLCGDQPGQCATCLK